MILQKISFISAVLLIATMSLTGQDFITYANNDLGTNFQQLAIDNDNQRVWVGTNQTFK